VAPIPVVAPTTIEKGGSTVSGHFAEGARIILIENNMVARADHGMIRLGGRSHEVRT